MEWEYVGFNCEIMNIIYNIYVDLEDSIGLKLYFEMENYNFEVSENTKMKEVQLSTSIQENYNTLVKLKVVTQNFM